MAKAIIVDVSRPKTRIELLEEELIDISDVILGQFIERDILSRMDRHEDAQALNQEISLCQTRKAIIKDLLEEAKKSQTEDFIELQVIMEIRK